MATGFTDLFIFNNCYILFIDPDPIPGCKVGQHPKSKNNQFTAPFTQAVNCHS